MVINQDLSFDKHIAAKINKANSILDIINNTLDYKNKEVMLTLFKSLVRPHIEFSNQFWAIENGTEKGEKKYTWPQRLKLRTTASLHQPSITII